MDSIKLNSLSSRDLKSLPANKPKVADSTTPFGDFLKKSLNEVNRLQKEADEAAEKLASGKEKDIHNTMIALKKAEVAFELVVQIQNKVMTAYDELKRMPL
jgi:flagellar hook-basal body complex protein FliE